MFVEIERKWLVDKNILGSIIRSGFVDIIQGYGNDKDLCIRVRITKKWHNSNAVVTIKKRITNLTTQEFNFDASIEDAKILIDGLPTIQKRRFTLPNDFTLDYFQGDLDGLLLVEKEFKTEQLAQNAILPPWLTNNIVEEVTDNPMYKNEYLVNLVYVPNVGLRGLGLKMDDSEEHF